MFTFLYSKFGKIIDPTLIVGKQGEPFDYDRISRLYVKRRIFDPRKIKNSPFNKDTIKVTIVKTEEKDGRRGLVDRFENTQKKSG